MMPVLLRPIICDNQKERESALSLVVRLMTVDDVAAVVAIDQVAKPSPWRAESFAAELDNPIARCVVLSLEAQIIGYCVSWLVAGELQIHTIAVALAMRGRRYGELLLVESLQDAVVGQAQLATLEVRSSNTAAQNLYRKYGFETVATRLNYYRDNSESALLMNADLRTDGFAERIMLSWQKIKMRTLGEGDRADFV